MLCVAGRVVTWSDFNIGRMLKTTPIFHGFGNVRELVENVRSDVEYIPEAPPVSGNFHFRSE